jgi:hypothetical protein
LREEILLMMALALRRLLIVITVFCAVVAASANSSRAQDVPARERAKILERVLEQLRSGLFDRPLLRLQQKASLEMVYTRDTAPVPIPDDEEIGRYRGVRASFDAAALDYLDDFYGSRDELKALALRDSDRDSVPDFRVSDFYGKFMEGDIDVDGDGVRNIYDRHPFDRSRGGRDADRDGIPDTGFADENANGVPDFVDWSIMGRESELAWIQLGLFRDHKILLVERNASFDLALAHAVDDTVRRVFRAYFEKNPVMPTLRTIATERTALLNAILAYVAEDDTNAQAFSQTQSLIIYNAGRDVDYSIGLLGLVVHEMGHSYHMSLDFDVDDPIGENGRTNFPVPNFAALVEPFGWTTSEYYDGDIGAGLPIVPRFVYAGMSDPFFNFLEETPEAWAAWVEEIYEQLGGSELYLLHADFDKYGVVSDYSLSTPYEWYSDNFIAYVITVIEEEALKPLSAGRSATIAAKVKVDKALRAIWPGFYHRNLASDVRTYFEATFPITEKDRRALAKRYLDPIMDAN